jgi:hypothetical protein
MRVNGSGDIAPTLESTHPEDNSRAIHKAINIYLCYIVILKEEVKDILHHGQPTVTEEL